MPEILYRDDVNRFSVYWAEDVPAGVPRTAKTMGSVMHWEASLPARLTRGTRDEVFCVFREWKFEHEPRTYHCAVADEHAGSMLEAEAVAVALSRKDSPTPFYKPTGMSRERYLSEETRRLGAQHGERQLDYRIGRSYPAFVEASEAWSAHLRFLVQRSAEADRASAPSVGWDPYGDE